MESLKLRNGGEIPQVGFGTYHLTDANARTLVATAIELGYRHVDTAENYRNESGVGAESGTVSKRGWVRREDLFVTSKLWPSDSHAPPGAGDHPLTDRVE